MRKRKAKKRPLLPDPRFNDQLVTRFVNNLMWDGKKSVAFKIFYDAMDIVDQKKTDDEKTARIRSLWVMNIETFIFALSFSIVITGVLPYLRQVDYSIF